MRLSQETSTKTGTQLDWGTDSGHWWSQSVVQCVHVDEGWIKVKVIITSVTVTGVLLTYLWEAKWHLCCFTFSAKTKILRWSTPPNCASTLRCSSSNAYTHRACNYYNYYNYRHTEHTTTTTTHTHRPQLLQLLQLQTHRAHNYYNYYNYRHTEHTTTTTTTTTDTHSTQLLQLLQLQTHRACTLRCRQLVGSTDSSSTCVHIPSIVFCSSCASENFTDFCNK